MNEQITTIMNHMKCGEDEARKLLNILEPKIVKQVIGKEPCHIYADYVKSVTTKNTTRKGDGTPFTIEVFQLASDVRITVFNRNDYDGDGSEVLEGTRVCFLIQDAKIYKDRVSYVGKIISCQEAHEKLTLDPKENHTDIPSDKKVETSQPLQPSIPQIPDVIDPSGSTLSKSMSTILKKMNPTKGEKL